MSSHYDRVMAIFNGSDDGDRTTADLLQAQFEDAYSKFKTLLSRKNATGDAIIERFNSTPAAVQRRLIASQELCGIVLSDLPKPGVDSPTNHDVLQQLHLVLSKVSIVDGVSTQEDTDYLLKYNCRSFVSPLGDVIMTYQGDYRWTRADVKKIGLTISLDFNSSLAMQHDPTSVVFDLPMLAWSDDEVNLVHRKLDQAISYINDATPALANLVRNFVRRIFLRKSLIIGDDGQIIGEPLAVTSEYLTRYPGAIGISNAHLNENTIVALMETILHESIHSLMHCFEKLYGDFMSADTSFRPVSPWSGNLIPNHALAHAIFVYFACYKLFERCVAINVFEAKSLNDEAKRRIGDLAVGFCIDRDLTELFLTSTSDEGLYDVIRMMQAEVKAEINHGIRMTAT